MRTVEPNSTIEVSWFSSSLLLLIVLWNWIIQFWVFKLKFDRVVILKFDDEENRQKLITVAVAWTREWRVVVVAAWDQWQI